MPRLFLLTAQLIGYICTLFTHLWLPVYLLLGTFWVKHDPSALGRDCESLVRKEAEGMRMKGLEPSRPKTLEPKSSASTNSATSAVCNAYYHNRYSS
jgi:hypothetical protein